MVLRSLRSPHDEYESLSGVLHPKAVRSRQSQTGGNTRASQGGVRGNGLRIRMGSPRGPRPASFSLPEPDIRRHRRRKIYGPDWLIEDRTEKRLIPAGEAGEIIVDVNTSNLRLDIGQDIFVRFEPIKELVKLRIKGRVFTAPRRGSRRQKIHPVQSRASYPRGGVQKQRDLSIRKPPGPESRIPLANPRRSSRQAPVGGGLAWRCLAYCSTGRRLPPIDCPPCRLPLKGGVGTRRGE